MLTCHFVKWGLFKSTTGYIYQCSELQLKKKPWNIVDVFSQCLSLSFEDSKHSCVWMGINVKWSVCVGWQVLRTSKMSHSAQFDLSKDILVRAYTVIDGPCTNNTIHTSKNYTELIQKPPRTGQSKYTCDFKKRRSEMQKMYKCTHWFYWHSARSCRYGSQRFYMCIL